MHNDTAMCVYDMYAASMIAKLVLVSFQRCIICAKLGQNNIPINIGNINKDQAISLCSWDPL